MSPSEPERPPTDQPAATIIQQLKAGLLAPSTLPKEQRQRCVEVLLLEGSTHSQIAQLLACSEKTIQRDVADIKVRNAASPPSVELARQFIGDYLLKMQAHHAYLMRLARIKEASVAERTQAEAAAAKLLNDFIDRLQSLGYLPQRPQQVIGDFVHRLDGASSEPTLEELEAQYQELWAIASQHALPTALDAQLQQLAQRLERARIAEHVHQLKIQQTESPPQEESHES